MDISIDTLRALLDAYAYEIVYADRTHTVRYMNRAARERYGDAVRVGGSLFTCHNEHAREKIEELLRRADAGEGEMFETLNGSTGEREFFVPVRGANGSVIGYFERHEVPWDPRRPDEPVGRYWERRA